MSATTWVFNFFLFVLSSKWFRRQDGHMIRAAGEEQNGPATEHIDCRESAPHRLFPSHRLLVTLIASFGYFCALASQTIVAASLLLMVRHHDDVSFNVSSTVTSATPDVTQIYSETQWHFQWSKTVTSRLMTSFFLGFYVIQFPLGWLLGRFGGYRLLLCSSVLTAICQGLSVWVPHLGPLHFAVLLSVTGFTNGVAVPSLVSVVAKWCPAGESTRLMSLWMSGGALGTATTYVVSAWVSRLQLYGGWPFIFVFIVVLQLMFIIMLWTYVSETPDEHRYISISELKYIHRTCAIDRNKSIQKVSLWLQRVPWRHILRSPPVYAVAASLIGADWMVYNVMTVLPPYLRSVRKMDTATVSLISGVPWFTTPVVSYLVAKAVDVIREKGVLSTATLRKIADVIAKPVAAMFLMTSNLVPVNDHTLTAGLHAMATITLTGFQSSGYMANIAELSPEYAGVIWAFTAIISMPGAFIAPLLFDAMTPHNTNAEWQWCYVVTLVLCVVTSLFYVIFSSSDRQDWDEEPPKKEQINARH